MNWAKRIISGFTFTIIGAIGLATLLFPLVISFMFGATVALLTF